MVAVSDRHERLAPTGAGPRCLKNKHSTRTQARDPGPGAAALKRNARHTHWQVARDKCRNRDTLRLLTTPLWTLFLIKLSLSLSRGGLGGLRGGPGKPPFWRTPARNSPVL